MSHVKVIKIGQNWSMHILRGFDGHHQALPTVCFCSVSDLLLYQLPSKTMLYPGSRAIQMFNI